MSSDKKKADMKEKNVLQAVVIMDTFKNEFRPISDDLPIALLPCAGKPLIEYTLEYLAFADVEEVYLFCCSHIEAIRHYMEKCKGEIRLWAVSLKVHILASETCCSFGDCLRDIYAKGIIRNNFILLEPGVISNIKLLPILEKHARNVEKDKGTAMTMIIGRFTIPRGEITVFTNEETQKIVHYFKPISKSQNIKIPVRVFLENPVVNTYGNAKDSGISICSPSVLSLFADNFDFQTKDDFIKGLIINEEILESSLYMHEFEGAEYGGFAGNWRSYHYLLWKFTNFYAHPITVSHLLTRRMGYGLMVSTETIVPKTCTLERTIVERKVVIGENVKMEESIIFPNCTIADNVSISYSLLGENCVIQPDCVIGPNVILGNGVVIESKTEVSDKLVISTAREGYKTEKLGEKAYIIIDDEDEDEIKIYHRNMTKFYWPPNFNKGDCDFSDIEADKLSCTNSAPPDDTRQFLNEVIDSLTRGFEDKLSCDNLILEVNSSRYAYNVTLREVNFNVVKALLHISFNCPETETELVYMTKVMNYFKSLIKNYIRNDEAMADCLQAVEEFAAAEETITEKWIVGVVKLFYDKDHLSEEAILSWYNNLNNTSKLYYYLRPFADWLTQAEEESSSEED